MLVESNEVCRLCDTEVVVCVPGTKAECGVYHEFLGMVETPTVNKQVYEPQISQTEISMANRGIMNRLKGQIVEIDKGQVMAKLTIRIGDNYISSLMPINDFLESGKNVDDMVSVAFKSSNVKLMV